MRGLEERKLDLLKIHSFANYIFIRIPKTGSASMNTSLWNATQEAQDQRKADGRNEWLQAPAGWWSHYSAKFCQDTLGKNVWDDTISFSIVRNPFARLYSWWKYEKQDIRFKDWAMAGCIHSLEVNNHSVCFPNNPVFCQVDWLTDTSGKTIVDFTIRLEELEVLGPQLFRSIVGEKFRICPVWWNKTSEPGEYKDHYDQELIDFVSDRCSKDIKKFNYTFDGFNDPLTVYTRD